jgi:hypothetical protein
MIQARLMVLLVALAACEPTAVELFSDARSGVGIDARAPLDADPGVDAAPDASAPDAMALDADAPDAAAPDASAPACVCRYTPCRLSSDCVAQVGAGSTCGGDFYCTGSVGTCRMDDECRPGFVCVVDARSTTRCP